MPVVTVTRRMTFNSAHRVHNPALSDEENVRLFGKCNNPSWHGHNYVLEVAVAGPVDPRTGYVIDLGDVKRIVQHVVIDKVEPTDTAHLVERFLTQFYGEQAALADASDDAYQPVPKEIIVKRGITRLAVTRRHASIDALCRRLQAALRADGPFNVQLRLHPVTGEALRFGNPRLERGL